MVGVAFETKMPPKYGVLCKKKKKSTAKKVALRYFFLENSAYTNQNIPSNLY